MGLLEVVQSRALLKLGYPLLFLPTITLSVQEFPELEAMPLHFVHYLLSN